MIPIDWRMYFTFLLLGLTFAFLAWALRGTQIGQQMGNNG